MELWLLTNEAWWHSRAMKQWHWSLYIHLYSSETLIAINNGNKFKQQKKSIRKKLCGNSAIIFKAAATGGIFNIKLFNTNWPQLTWQLKTKVRLTVSYNLDVTRSEHLLTTKSKELSSDLARGHASRPYNKLGMHLVLINCKTTSSDATRPTFPKIAFAEQ